MCCKKSLDSHTGFLKSVNKSLFVNKLCIEQIKKQFFEMQPCRQCYENVPPISLKMLRLAAPPFLRIQGRNTSWTRFTGIQSCERQLYKYVKLRLLPSSQRKNCHQERCKSTTFTNLARIEAPSPALTSAQIPTKEDMIYKTNIPDWENEGKVAYQHRNTIDLLRSYIILASIPYVPKYCIKHGESIIRFVEKYLLGRKLTNLILRQTIFKQFCAGENYFEIQYPLQQLQQQYGIGCILDHVAEASTTTNDGVKDNNNNKLTAAYDSSDNNPYDDNMKILEQCIYDTSLSAAAVNKTNSPYVAVKMTALGNERMFRIISLYIHHIQSLFSKLKDNGDGHINYKDLQLSLQQSSMPIEYQSMLTKHLRASFIEYRNEIISVDSIILIDDTLWMQIWLPINDRSNAAYNLSETLELFRIVSSALDARCNNIVDAARCNTSHSVNHDDKNKYTTPAAVGLSTWQLPTSDDIRDFQEMINRIKQLADPIMSSAKLSSKQHVRLLIDAEQTWYQPAIDYATYELQRIYNNADTVAYPIISNTYQMYLTDSYIKLQNYYCKSLCHNFHFGCKLVRGAYMEEERYNAIANGVPSPIHSTIEDTHNNYNTAVSFLVTRMHHSSDTNVYHNKSLQAVASHHKSEVMCATHNVESVEWAMQTMNKIDRQQRSQSDLSNSKRCSNINIVANEDAKQELHSTNVTISFAQLYGMKAWMTYTLGGRGYNVYKYVPYGPVSLAIPYLLRRATENTSFLKPSPSKTVVNGKSSSLVAMPNDLDMIKRELMNRMKKLIVGGL